MRQRHLTPSDAAENCRRLSLIFQEMAFSAMGYDEDWRWYNRAFLKVAEHLEKDRLRMLEQEGKLEVPAFLMLKVGR